MDKSFASRKKDLGVGKTKREKGTKIMSITDRYGLPIEVPSERAAPVEVAFLEDLLETHLTKGKPTVCLVTKHTTTTPSTADSLREESR